MYVQNNLNNLLYPYLNTVRISLQQECLMLTFASQIFNFQFISSVHFGTIHLFSTEYFVFFEPL